MQILNTTAHLEEIEGVIGKLLCRGARRKRSVVDGLAVQSPQARRD